MKTIPRTIALLILFTFSASSVFAQANTTNKGTEFWTVWMDHVDATLSNMSLYITGDANTTGSADAADGSFSLPFTVTANQVTTVTIPTSAFLGSDGQFKKGIHITSAKNIVVYAHIYANARSGATLVLPVNAMGKDYYSINYTQIGNGNTQGNSAFCVIATVDNTTVEITPTADLLSGNAANVTFQVTLAKGEVYQGLSMTDLTGTRIKSVSNSSGGCQKIAVYSGSSFVKIGCTPGKTTADNLFQQVYPTSSWGKNFISAPLSGRNYDVFRIIYSDPTANVQVNGNTIPASSIINNIYYEFSSSTPDVVTSDKPIQLVQYAVTEGSNINCTANNESIGDPEMIFLTPIEQGLDHVTLYSTDKQNIQKSFINVIIPASAASSFIIDGQSGTSFTPVPGNTAYSYTQLQVGQGAAAGTHNISASTPFNAIAYGFGSVESYGYAAGTDLKNLNEFITLRNPATNAITSVGCTGIAYVPRISIPYQTTSITWNLEDGSTPVTDNAPVLKGTTLQGTQTLYIYEYNGTINYPVSGSYSIIATVFNPTSDDCGSNEDIELDYNISDVPVASFSAPATACPAAPVTFTDKTNTKGISTQTWAWDFGDAANATVANPDTSAIQNPQHIYIKPGDYTVTLTVTNTNGCTSAFQQAIHISKPPAASFTASTPDCETRDITFTDTSLPGDVANTTWLWDFGDNSGTVTHTNNLPFTHQYAQAGIYNVSLTVTGSAGCASNVFTQTVTVSPLPVVDFSLPDVCLSDSFAQFTDKSTIADNSNSLFTYSWNFGDPNATPANNVSTLQNPTHKYTAVRDASNPYIVTLTITSNNGCAVTKSQPFTVNGDTPKAAFTVENPTGLCSGDNVIFDDNSTVNFGNVTKIVWYFDYNNHPNDSTVYTRDQFTTDHKYTHNYGLFYTPATQTYAVKMEAYSGISCVSVSAIQNITVKANPSVTLSKIDSICQEAAPVQIVATVNNGFTGTSVFTGTGVSASGLFDPAQAGPGTFTINYTFTADNGCDYTTSEQVIVYPTPTANAGPDLYILVGGQQTINATATGTAPLTYKWTLADGSKATGLDHDNVLNPIASPTDDVTYLLTVTSANGCTASSKVSITALKAPVVPNTFTPNNDGVNDTWDIKYLDSYPNCTVEIYNRYGEKLYTSIGYPIPWDGNYKGLPLPAGVYYYIINPKNGRKVISGSVTIIR